MRHRCRERTDGCQRGGGLGDWVKKVKELRSTDWQLQNSDEYINYSIENIVNNIDITMYGDFLASFTDLLLQLSQFFSPLSPSTPYPSLSSIPHTLRSCQ